MDFTIINHGSVYIFTPQTAEAREWANEHVDAHYLGRGFAVEPRYVDDLICGIEGYGMSVGGV